MESLMESVQLIVNILIGVAGFSFAVILNRLFKRDDDFSAELTELKDKLNALAVKVPSEYVHKIEFNHMIDALFKKLDRIEQKIDQKVDKV